jgi:hypothetical protein
MCSEEHKSMNTKKHSTPIPATTKPGRTTMNRQGKTANPMEGSGAPDKAGHAAPRSAPAAPPAPAFIALAPSFVALADQFGMVPERLAERVIAAFAATRPTRITVKKL